MKVSINLFKLLLKIDIMEGDRPLCTIIIPTYCRPQMLERAVRSVLNQTCQNFQICIYDNASADETKSVVHQLASTDSRIRYFRHAKNIGIFANFNYGLQDVNTPYFSFLSDDDLLLPSFLETTLAGFDKHPEAMFSAGLCIAAANNSITTVASVLWRREGCLQPPQSLLEIVEGKHILWTSVLFRKEVIDFVGALDEEIGRPFDLDFLLRIAAHYPIVLTKVPCAIYTIHEVAYTQSIKKTTDFSKIIGWTRLVSKISSDNNISPAARSQVTRRLEDTYVKSEVFEEGITAIKNKEYGYAVVLARILSNDLNDRKKSYLLRILSKLHELSSPAFFGLASLRQIYIQTKSKLKLNKENKQKNKLQKQFGEYLRYLEGS